MTSLQTLAWLGVVVLALCFGFIAGLIVNAPRGHQDKRGFHYGDSDD